MVSVCGELLRAVLSGPGEGVGACGKAVASGVGVRLKYSPTIEILKFLLGARCLPQNAGKWVFPKNFSIDISFIEKVILATWEKVPSA